MVFTKCKSHVYYVQHTRVPWRNHSMGISHIYFQSAGVKAKLILHFSQMYIIISYTFCDSYLWYEYGFSLVVHYSLFRIIGL